jgi:hypothetical protein
MDLLLAIHREKRLQEVRLEKAASTALTGTFETLTEAFHSSQAQVSAYAPGFKPEDDDLQFIEYDLPEFLWRCRNHLPNDVTPLGAADLTDDPPLALVALTTGRAPLFCFQAIDSRNTLRPGWAVLFNPHGFKLQREIGVAVPERLDALHRDGKLFFRSEHVVRRFLDIDAFFREATDQEIKTLFTHETFAVDDWDNLNSAATTPMRRKLNAILKSGRTFTPAQIGRAAKRADVRIRTRGGAVVVPTERGALRDFVRIIDDAYLQSLLDGNRVYLTTSKRPLAAGP